MRLNPNSDELDVYINDFDKGCLGSALHECIQKDTRGVTATESDTSAREYRKSPFLS